ncbi:hypothetical protein DFP72DRAFT_851543 [Ephemerocybe angulata]|uniref:Uncharacterized protein n=1 Tax=Ephemerocybe angulata TaxID=980116 RepID=A0A8H6HQU5_9AGAR|nr:hypothetical protein DFP72DRAFT_851543 [Tulosesus angulatus]
MPLVVDLQRFQGEGTGGLGTSVDAHDAFLRSLSLRDLKKVSSLTPLAPIVQRHLHDRVESMWKAFHLPSSPSLGMLKDTGSIVSGSAALDLILPGLRTPRDLNLYCPEGAASAVLSYLFSHKFILQGPPLVWNSMKEGRSNNCFNINNGVKSLHRLKHLEESALITVVESVSLSPILPILFFHTTFTMNYCDDKEITCLYPNLTACSVGLNNRSEDYDRLHKTEATQKWEQLGIELVWNCDSKHRHYSENTTALPFAATGKCQRQIRTLDDAITLRMGFTEEKRISSDLKITWSLGYTDWMTNKVEYVDTHVSITTPTTGTKYSTLRHHRRALDWKTHRENDIESDGETSVARTSFP